MKETDSVRTGRSKPAEELLHASRDSKGKSNAKEVSPTPSPVSTPTPIEVSPEIDPKEKLMAERKTIKKLVCRDVWSDDMSTVESALEALADLCTQDSEENRTEIVRAGGHLAIIKAMEKNLLSPAIQAQGCRALQNLTVKIGGQEEQPNRIESAARSMMSRCSLPACSGLLPDIGCLEPFGLVSVNEDNLSRIVDAGGVVVVVAAMKTHPRDSRVQALACGALYNLSCHDKYKNALEDDGAMSALAGCIENHRDVEYIQKWGRATLRRLAA